MKKQLLGFLLLFLVCPLAFAQFAVQQYDVPDNFTQHDLATDALENVVICGSFPLSYNNPTIAYKYTPTGAVAWSVAAMATNSLKATQVATDQAGNVYLAGMVNGNGQLAGGPVWNTGGSFLAKYSPSGTLLWSQHFGSAWFTGLACNSANDVILSGYTSWDFPQAFGSVSVPINTGFVVRYSASGVPGWVRQISGSLTPNPEFEEITLDQNDNIYLAGQFENTVTIGSMAQTGSWDLFLAKLSPAGDPLWLKAISGSLNYQPGKVGISTNAAGNVYLTGMFHTHNSGTMTFDNLNLAGNSSGGFLACYSSAGTVQWAKYMGSPTPQNYYVQPVDVVADDQGNTYVAGRYWGNAQFGATTFAMSTLNYGNVFFCMLNPAAEYEWAISADSTNWGSGASQLVMGQNNTCYLAGEGSSNSWNNNFNFGGISSTDFGPFVYKFKIGGYNRISGTVFYDQNYNGIRDLTEPAARRRVVQVNSWHFSTNNAGTYIALADEGANAVTLPVPPLYYNLVPASHTVTFNGYGNVDNSRHFALQAIPGMQDLEITLATGVPPRPGFAYPIQLIYRNVGTVALTGTAEITLDPLLTLTGTTPAASSQSGNTLTWALGNLAPLQSGAILIGTEVPANAALGDTVNLSAQLLPLAGDLTPANNAKTLAALVTGAFDPNDKQVSQNWITPTEIAAAKPLEYTIRFQNTGTDTAFTVRLVDTLDAQLNIPTFELLASSHPNTWTIRENGNMEFRFDNILLPDSNTNEPASHGFVKYRIRPNTNLPLGSIIRNTAAIYFDFNEPVITNTASTEVALVSAVTDVHKPQLLVYPNPNKGSFTVQLQNVQEQSVKAELRNVLGQIVWQQNLVSENGNVEQQIKTSHLSKGIYYLQISTGKGTAVQKVVLE